MAAGGSIDEINGHWYLIVMSCLLYKQPNTIKCYKFLAFRGSITKGAAIFFSCIYIRGIFPSYAGKPRECAIVQ